MLKKIGALLCIAIMCIPSVWFAAIDSDLSEADAELLREAEQNIDSLYDAIESRDAILELPNGQEKLDQIDRFVESLSAQQKAVLETKLNNASIALSDKSWYKADEARIIIAYIQTLVVSPAPVELIETQAPEPLVVLSAGEIEQVDASVLKMQSSMVAMLETNMQQLLGGLEQSLYTQSQGDLNVSVLTNFGENMDIDLELNLSNYEVIQNKFDSRFKTDMSALFKTDSYWEKVELDISSFVDYISKDGNIYILLEDLNIAWWDDIEELEVMLEEIRTVFEDNTYIHIPADSWYDEVLSFLESLDPNVFMWEVATFFEEPLLRAHSKVGDKYILVPTQYACDQGKTLQNRFDPFYDDTKCSPSQYEDLVEEFLSEEAMLYMSFENGNSVFGLEIEDYSSYTDMNMVFDGQVVRSATMTSVPKDGSYEGLNMSYDYKTSFDMSLKSDGVDMTLDMQLDASNSMKSMRFDMQMQDSYNTIDATLSMRQQKISWALNVYDSVWEDVFAWDISGTYDDDYVNIKSNFELADNPFSSSSFEVLYLDEAIEGEECYDVSDYAEYYNDSNYICYVTPDVESVPITGQVDLEYDISGSNNNMKFLFDMLEADTSLFKLEVENRGTQINTIIDIEAPENSTPIDEISTDINLY